MKAEAKAVLWDAHQATLRITRFVDGKRFSDYQQDELLKSAVERQFEIVGEALNKLSRIDAEAVAKIPDAPRIIAFRNILIHGYATVDDRLVWGIVEDKLKTLRDQLSGLLESPETG